MGRREEGEGVTSAKPDAEAGRRKRDTGIWAAAISLAQTDWLTRSAFRCARRLLDQVADGLEDVRRRCDARAAGRDADWHEGPDGRRCVEALRELDGVVSALRRVTLPEEEALR